MKRALAKYGPIAMSNLLLVLLLAFALATRQAPAPRGAAGTPAAYVAVFEIPRGTVCDYQKPESGTLLRELRCQGSGYLRTDIYSPDRPPVSYVASWIYTTPATSTPAPTRTPTPTGDSGDRIGAIPHA